MEATIKTFKQDRAAGVSYDYAPSLSAALRADAELLVKLVKESALAATEGALTKYTTGGVEADVTCTRYTHDGDDEYFVEFYKTGATRPFAIVEVK